MIGPSRGTFSPPTTRTSVKKDHTAHPANRLRTLCSVCGSGSAMVNTVRVVWMRLVKKIGIIYSSWRETKQVVRGQGGW